MLLSIPKIERHCTVLEKCLSLPTSWRDLWCLSPWQPTQPGPPCGEKVPQSQQTLPFSPAIPGAPQSHSPRAPGSAWPTGSHVPGRWLQLTAHGDLTPQTVCAPCGASASEK